MFLAGDFYDDTADDMVAREFPPLDLGSNAERRVRVSDIRCEGKFELAVELTDAAKALGKMRKKMKRFYRQVKEHVIASRVTR
jgi:hypothetical protein